MIGLIGLRDLLAQQGRMQPQQISQHSATPLSLVEAMLLRLEAMGRAERVQDMDTGCPRGRCRTCPESKACTPVWWRLKA